MKQVFLYNFMTWVQVVSENDEWYGVISPDGVNTIVLKSEAMVRGA